MLTITTLVDPYTALTAMYAALDTIAATTQSTRTASSKPPLLTSVERATCSTL